METTLIKDSFEKVLEPPDNYLSCLSCGDYMWEGKLNENQICVYCESEQ